MIRLVILLSLRRRRLTWALCGMALGVAAAGSIRAATAAVSAPTVSVDVLVYANGDQLRGHLVSREGGMIVFKSERFGELCVPASQARILPTTPSTETAGTSPSASTATPEGPLPPIPWSVRIARTIFGSWHGRLSFAATSVHDTNDRTDYMVSTRIERKWARDEIRVENRYDFSERNDTTATDRLTGGGYWRHDFTPRWFSLYRPTVESNRSYFSKGVPADYLLVQQELGIGMAVWTKAQRALRFGVAENVFDNWSLVQNGHVGAYFESLFWEAEMELPGRLRLSNRGAWYPLLNGGRSWENQLELSKKLTSALSFGLRHEVRYNAPDMRAQDYSLWRFVMGYDF